MSGADREPVLLGVRHHGPGSARAVRRALSAYRPEVVLIEGPPEADDLVELAGDEAMRAPVALLAYPSDAVRVVMTRGGAAATSGGGGRLPAAFWPFAEFSPEWQAVRWALANDVPVRFIDLPAAVRLAIDTQEGSGDGPASTVRTDPIAALAAAAGYDDPERWWEDAIEHRLTPTGTGLGSATGGQPANEVEAATAVAEAIAPFAAIAEAMRAVRSQTPQQSAGDRLDEERREAHMRRALRVALKEHDRVAVVCGAWHVPALEAPLPAATADAATLRGLPRLRTSLTWVPWTHARMASWQGYGAGVSSPGWYHHLFTSTDQPVVRWLVAAAAVLRKDGIDVSSAHVIEATRLAETLATIRGRPLAGLAEVTDAARAALCDGDEVRLALINRKLVIGDRLGRVPDATRGVPAPAAAAAGAGTPGY